MTDERWVGIPEVAQHLSISEYTARRLAKSGAIPGIKIGHQWRFRLTAVDAHLGPPKPPEADPWKQSPRSAAGRKAAETRARNARQRATRSD